MALIVVSGALANKPSNGGAAWTRLSWALGLKRLGHDVYFVEQISSATCADASGARCDAEQSINLAYFEDVTMRFGLGGTSSLIVEEDGRAFGVGLGEIRRVARSADLLVNISGHLTLDTLKPAFRRRAFIDLDPGYTQFWHLQKLADDQLRDHHEYFTVGENIGRAGCSIPPGGIPWRPIRQPIVLDEWPVSPAAIGNRFTTIASWRGPYGRAAHAGRQFGVKAHEFRKFAALPTLATYPFEIALDVDPADQFDRYHLERNAWSIVDPRSVAGDPFRFRRYIQESSAECSVAQGVYVETQSGWFSDRTVRYLASGKPALVQDTGFGRTYPTGCGLVAFRTLEEAAAGAETIVRNYEAHSRAARSIAETFFDSNTVLAHLLSTTGVTS